MRIILNNINKSYDGRAVLSDFSLKSTAPEVISVMGASGSGKPLYLELLAGLENGDSGEVITEGKLDMYFRRQDFFRGLPHWKT